MRRVFNPNINNKGRLVRACIALALLIGAAFGFSGSAWLGAGLLAAALFVSFEAARGWCALRACGIRTRL